MCGGGGGGVRGDAQIEKFEQFLSAGTLRVNATCAGWGSGPQLRLAGGVVPPVLVVFYFLCLMFSGMPKNKVLREAGSRGRQAEGRGALPASALGVVRGGGRDGQGLR